MDMEILQDYLPEAQELLQKAQEDTLRLEGDPDNDEILASLFRAFHTLKGGAGFLEAQNLVDWTHHLEDLLDKLRSHSLSLTPVMIDTILRGLDVIEGMLQELGQGEYPAPGPQDLGALIQELAAGRKPVTGESTIVPSIETNEALAPVADTRLSACPPAKETLFASQRETQDGRTGTYVEQGNVPAASAPAGSEALAGSNETISEEEFEATLDALYGQQAPGLVDPPEAACTPADEITQDEFEQVLDQLYGQQAPSGVPTPGGALAPGFSPPKEPTPSAEAPKDLPKEPKKENPPKTPATTAPEAAETTLRVDAGRLDAVMNQVGELVLLRNRLAAAVGSLGEESEDMLRIAREMDLTVNDLQSTVMRLRMQPCKRLFQQLPRVVRDVSRQLGKEVRLEIVGEDVEIDKTVVDALSGPLIHLVRNSLDHGIEAPADREQAGKSKVATLRVAAIHLGDKVRIEVADDGKGIDRGFVTQKAIAKGVITAEQAAHLSEQEALELIFRPGFSTKDQATDLSGRGVGMDVVKETVRKLRGRLDLQTRLGQGTSLAMEFPLTLAVLPVLYLRLRRDIYAMPVSAINSLLDIDDSRMHTLKGKTVYRVNGAQVTPIVDLGALLHQKPMALHSETVEGVLTDRGLFLVSEVLGNEDSVVKPIDFLAEQNWYQGATISGKGSVVLILDPNSLAALEALEGVA